MNDESESDEMDGRRDLGLDLDVDVVDLEDLEDLEHEDGIVVGIGDDDDDAVRDVRSGFSRDNTAEKRA